METVDVIVVGGGLAGLMAAAQAARAGQRAGDGEPLSLLAFAVRAVYALVEPGKLARAAGGDRQ